MVSRDEGSGRELPLQAHYCRWERAPRRLLPRTDLSGLSSADWEGLEKKKRREKGDETRRGQKKICSVYFSNLNFFPHDLIRNPAQIVQYLAKTGTGDLLRQNIMH